VPGGGDLQCYCVRFVFSDAQVRICDEPKDVAHLRLELGLDEPEEAAAE
jgi:hypothetical protein